MSRCLCVQTSSRFGLGARFLEVDRVRRTGVLVDEAAHQDVVDLDRPQGGAAGLVDGEPADMAEQFLGLLWGSKLLGLLLNINERPSVREIAVRAEKAASAFLLAHPAPGVALER